MMNCRHCGQPLTIDFVDLESCPPSNAYLKSEQLNQPEAWYPLRVMVCEKCWLVQTLDIVGFKEMFTEEYAYLSSYSDSWLKHASAYVDYVTDRFGLGSGSKVVEIASNDGYLLQNCVAKGIPCLGVEPTHIAAEISRKKGIPTIEEFFGVGLATKLLSEKHQADLMLGNNVLAHVPDLNDFLNGFRILLKPDGVVTFEFPHLMKLMEGLQFDTIYHEHFSYYSLHAIKAVFETNGLFVFDVEQIPTHGGSLRIFGQRADAMAKAESPRVAELLRKEKEAGLLDISSYTNFGKRIERIKLDLLEFLVKEKKQGRKVAAYGAAAKGNTLLNFAGVKKDLLSYVVDRNPVKAGKFMPGSRIPIVSEEVLKSDKPDTVFILPWNLREEIQENLSYIRSWGGKFAVATPKLSFF